MATTGTSRQKSTGAYFTPDDTVNSLVRWAVRCSSDRMLDPSCGDGRFLAAHPNSTGVELDPDSFATARERAPHAMIHNREFFSWASSHGERFDCAVGNPPFIRYQRFAGQVRQDALHICQRHGVKFSSLASSWAPFLVAASSLLKPGGRMAFVVPAEIGHAPYARPMLEYFVSSFDAVTIVPVRNKIFSDLSEDCWLLFANGYGGSTDTFRLTPMDGFGFMPSPPTHGVDVTLLDWAKANYRLRPFLLSTGTLAMYRTLADGDETARLGDAARVGIGYVTGDNDFFHLRPSQATAAGIPFTLLKESVRNGRALPAKAVTRTVVNSWITRDQPIYLLHIPASSKLPRGVRRYLESPAGEKAQQSYKCRNRSPWYTVPDVSAPDAFISYMSGDGPALVANHASCVCTNSLHAVRLTNGLSVSDLQRAWQDPFTRLSCEIEGHPLGGGLLKLEPREASRVALLTHRRSSQREKRLIRDGIATLRRWRHIE